MAVMWPQFSRSAWKNDLVSHWPIWGTLPRSCYLATWTYQWDGSSAPRTVAERGTNAMGILRPCTIFWLLQRNVFLSCFPFNNKFVLVHSEIWFYDIYDGLIDENNCLSSRWKLNQRDRPILRDADNDVAEDPRFSVVYYQNDGVEDVRLRTNWFCYALQPCVWAFCVL